MYCMEYYYNIYSLVVQAKKQVTAGIKQAEGYKEEVENSVTHMNRLESNATLFSRVTSFFWDAWLTCAHTASVCHKLFDITQCCHNGCGSPYEEHMSYLIPARMCVVSSGVSSISAFVYV